MGVIVSWYNPEQTIIYIEFERKWTWDDVYAIDDITTEMLLSVNNPVCFLVDVSVLTGLPRGMSVTKLKKVLNFEHSNSVATIIYGISPFLRPFFVTLVNAVGASTSVIFARDETSARMAAQERLAAHTDIGTE